MEDESPQSPKSPVPKKRSFSPELIIALSAVFVSIVTLFVYIYQARIMREQLRTSAWPYVQWSYTQLSNKGFTLSVHNKGIGPALLKSTTLKYKGEVVTDVAELIKNVIGKDTVQGLAYSNIDHTVMAPGDRDEFFHVEVKDDRQYEKLLPKLGIEFYNDLSFTICYCDIYGRCWQSTGNVVKESDCGE